VAKLSHLQLLLMTRSPQKTMDLRRLAVVDEASAAREEVGEEDIAEKEVDGDMVEGEIVVVGAISVVGGMANTEDVERVTVVGEMVIGEVEAKASVEEETATKVTVVEEMGMKDIVDEEMGMRATAVEEMDRKATVDGETDRKVTADEETDKKVTVAVGGDEAKDVAGPLLIHNRGGVTYDHPVCPNFNAKKTSSHAPGRRLRGWSLLVHLFSIPPSLRCCCRLVFLFCLMAATICAILKEKEGKEVRSI